MALTPDERTALDARRDRIAAAMGDGVLLLAAAPERVRSADVHHPYRQDSDFEYATGLDEPESVALIAPGATHPFVLFVRPHDPERAIWVGPRAGIDGATGGYGADNAFPIEDLEKELPKLLAPAQQVFLPLAREDTLARRLLDVVRRVQAERPRTGTGPTLVRDAGEVLGELRLHKDPDELARMRRSIGIACEAHRSAMQTARPGMREYEIEALLDYHFRRAGAAGPAYPSIVAAGANATILHYTHNAAALDSGQLLLIDAGCEHGGYCADVTRTFPVGPRFAGAARDLYEAVLAAQLAALAAVAPGVTLESLHATAVRVLAERLVDLKLLEEPVEQVVEQELYKRFYMHRTSHWLGRDVHDVGAYRIGDAPRGLEPDMVFTVEPGLYVPADAEDVPPAFRGIGIRIEDDVLVTAAGSEVLSAAAPKTIADIESLRAAAGA
jgi:Xaa-Pro aminopeptidase